MTTRHVEGCLVRVMLGLGCLYRLENPFAISAIIYPGYSIATSVAIAGGGDEIR